MTATAKRTMTEAMLEVPGTEPMAPVYRRLHRSFVAFNAVAPLVGLVVAGVWLWGRGVTALDLVLLAGLHVLTTLGVTVGLHRMLAHRAFRAGPWVRGLFAVLGTMAMQGPVLKWVAEHRRHHAYSDQAGDPHSPHLDPDQGVGGLIRGLWWAHVGWMFAPVRTRPERWAPDLLADPVIVRIDRLYVPLATFSLALPTLIGWAVTGTGQGALQAFVWGGLVRVFLQLHTTWSINSVCHVFGRRTYVSHDEAANVGWLAWLSLGESWHNNHHAFPASARHGLDPRQPDASAWLIERMERSGLVDAVKRPSPSQREQRRMSAP